MTNTMLGRDVAADEVGRLDPITLPCGAGALTEIRFEGSELQALCPAVAGIQPDIYDWSITFVPALVSIESKSLKLYLTTWRDRRIFAEHLAAAIARDVAACVGVVTTVVLRQNIRGGIIETVTGEGVPE